MVMEGAGIECEKAVGSSAASYATNFKFHDATYHASRNRFLAEQILNWRQRLEPYRRRISYHPRLMRKSATERHLIMGAIFSIYESGVAHAMGVGINSLRDTISDLIESIGESLKR